MLPEPRCCPSCELTCEGWDDLGYDITFGAFRQSEDGQPGELASEIQPGFAGCFVSWGSRSYTGQEKTECVGPVIEFSLMLE